METPLSRRWINYATIRRPAQSPLNYPKNAIIFSVIYRSDRHFVERFAILKYNVTLIQISSEMLQFFLIFALPLHISIPFACYCIHALSFICASGQTSYLRRNLIFLSVFVGEMASCESLLNFQMSLNIYMSYVQL